MDWRSFMRSHSLNISVNQILEMPEPEFYPSPSSAQLELTITVQVKFTRHFCSIDSSVDLNHFSFPVSPEILRFDLQVLENQQEANRLIASMLTKLRITPSDMFDVVVDVIIRQGLEIANLECNRGRKVLSLATKLTILTVQHVHRDVAVTLRQLPPAFRRNNFGMVPATCLSVKEMVKRSRVKDGDEEVNQNCTICLEEFKVKSMISRMPCSHTFHTICIEQWLNTNHYCPLCRFEMPTFK